MGFFEEFERMRREMDKMFDDMSKMKFETPELETNCKIEETENEVIVYIDMPGIKKEDIQLTVTEDSIEAKAERRGIKEERGKNFRSMQKSYSGYHVLRSFPAKVKPETSQAAYIDGVLTIKFEKAEEEKKKVSKKIKIK